MENVNLASMYFQWYSYAYLGFAGAFWGFSEISGDFTEIFIGYSSI
jgi:hypothetical protein